MTDLQNDEWLNSVEEIAAAMGEPSGKKGIRRTYRMCERGEIPAIKLAGRWRARRRAIVEHIERLERNALAGSFIS